MNKSKLDNFELMNKETGEIVENTKEVAESVLKEDFKNRKDFLNYKFKNTPLEMTLEEILEYREFNKMKVKDVIVSIDFKGMEYFTFKKDKKLLDKLSMNTKGAIYDLGMRITHSGFITYENGIPIRSSKELMNFLKFKPYTWKKVVWKELKEHNIVVKEKIRGQWYLVVNPLFSIKSRGISEYMFICFHKEIKKYIKYIDYLYLIKTLGINPEG